RRRRSCTRRRPATVHPRIFAHAPRRRSCDRIMSTQAHSMARTDFIRRGLRLEYVTLLWNSLEAVIAIVSGILAGSIALVGFGFDSIIECASGATLVWRLRSDAEAHRREQIEKRALQLVGVSFLLLAAYVGYEAITALLKREEP